MTSRFLLHELVVAAAQSTPQALALVDGDARIDYATLWDQIASFAARFQSLDLKRGDRIAIWIEKRTEAVAAIFASSLYGAVFVPINPLLKTAQVGHILLDCSVSALVTTSARRPLLDAALNQCPSLRHVIVIDSADAGNWQTLCSPRPRAGHRVIDADMAGIFYTSGSTGRPKGVMVSHRNLVTGARSVASYLGNHAEDRLLAALPLSFDAGFSQLTTAFSVGASVTLLNYLMPRDVLKAMEREQITGLTAVPPLWIQLAQLDWPEAAAAPLRYFANTGGRMPRATLTALRQRAPKAKPYLMYGLTEAFRATYLAPEEVDRRPDSIGRAIPNAEVLVLREDGSECVADEAGELVQRGALVAMGYWNDIEKTAERFKPLLLQAGAVLPEIAVFSGDTVRRDAEGFLYFIGRRDEMIKTSGYRVSPTEVEEACYATQLFGEVAAVGVEHPLLGQAIVIFGTARDTSTPSLEALTAALRQLLPAWMLPSKLVLQDQALPRNPNGKIDRRQLGESVAGLFTEDAT